MRTMAVTDVERLAHRAEMARNALTADFNMLLRQVPGVVTGASTLVFLTGLRRFARHRPVIAGTAALCLALASFAVLLRPELEFSNLSPKRRIGYGKKSNVDKDWRQRQAQPPQGTLGSRRRKERRERP